MPEPLSLLQNYLLLSLRSQGELSALENLTPAQWEELLQMAKIQDLSPLLYWRLVHEKAVKAVPPSVADALRNAFYKCLADNSVYFDDLYKILAAFEQAGIQVILLKGAYLAEKVYPNVGLRPMDDFDLMVRRADYLRGHKLLEELGFTGHRRFFSETELDHGKHGPIMSRPGSKDIELHWTLVDDRSDLEIDEETLWQGSRLIQLPGTTAWVLSLENMLLHLCAHISYGHMFQRQPRSLVDIARLLETGGEQVNWQEVVQTAHTWKSEAGIFLALYLAHSLLDAPVPAPVISALKPIDFTPQVADWAVFRLFQENYSLSSNFNSLFASPSFLERIRALFTAFFPGRIILSQAYNVPPNSWRIYLVAPRYAWERITHYGGHTLRMAIGRHPGKTESEIEYQLNNWLSGS